MPVVVLIAAGCNSSPQVSTQTPAPIQAAQTTTQTPSSAPTASPTPTMVAVTPTPTTNTKDYGTDFAGFVAASKTCSPSEVNATINQNTGLGVINNDSEHAQILGYSGQYCHIFSTRTAFSVVVDTSLENQYLASGKITQAQLDTYTQSIAQYNQSQQVSIGMTQDCTFTLPLLATYLGDWQNPSTGSSATTASLNQYCKITLPKAAQGSASVSAPMFPSTQAPTPTETPIPTTVAGTTPTLGAGLETLDLYQGSGESGGGNGGALYFQVTNLTMSQLTMTVKDNASGQSQSVSLNVNGSTSLYGYTMTLTGIQQVNDGTVGGQPSYDTQAALNLVSQ